MPSVMYKGSRSLKSENTPVMFFIKKSSYVSGTGSVRKFEPFEYQIDSEGNTSSLVWVNWQMYYGNWLLSPALQGIKQPARITCPYIPQLYDALMTQETLVYKYNGTAPDIADGVPNIAQMGWYKVTSGIEDIGEEQRQLEFAVARIEAM